MALGSDGTKAVSTETEVDPSSSGAKATVKTNIHTGIVKENYLVIIIDCLCWGFTAQSTQWGHVECGQFT